MASSFYSSMVDLDDDYPSPWAARAAADASAESTRATAEQTARTNYDAAIAGVQQAYADSLASADEARQFAQSDALRDQQTTVAQANLQRATDKATADTTAAASGVAINAVPVEEEAPEDPEDVAGDRLGEDAYGGLVDMPLLDPGDTESLLQSAGGATGYCTTLDLGICFAAGTPVLLADGSTKPIEQIQPGDLVLSAPEDDAEAAPTAKTVERVFHNPPSELVCLTIARQEIRCTPPHLFYVKEKGWTAAEDLEVGDELRTFDGRWVALDAKKHQSEPEPVFNFRVADHHTCFVGDPAGGEAVLVHNEYEMDEATIPITLTQVGIDSLFVDRMHSYFQLVMQTESRDNWSEKVEEYIKVLLSEGAHCSDETLTRIRQYVASQASCRVAEDEFVAAARAVGPYNPASPYHFGGGQLDLLPGELVRIAGSAEAEDEASRIGWAIHDVFSDHYSVPSAVLAGCRNAIQRPFGLPGDEHNGGYFCYEWAYGFEDAFYSESSGEYFTVEVEEASVSGSARVHYWIAVTSVKTGLTIYVDDGFMNGDYVHLGRPEGGRYQYGPGITMPRSACNPPTAPRRTGPE